MGRRGHALDASGVSGSRCSRLHQRGGAGSRLAASRSQRLEVVADGLPLFHGAQIAVDTTLVSPLRQDPTPHSRCALEDGAALHQARRRKERVYPELSGAHRRGHLVVLASEVGGRSGGGA